ncbi:U3 small nucleolar RNA-associated protein [Phlyctema vagabunda]|uniref:U3 small nucleolar RNA-associated protein n=1 Tax=Phlyctema vagabunda TaxID=108571 RepID=A0ABR4P6X7_9HELO
MPRQRSKKLSANRAKSESEPKIEIERHEVESGSESDSIDILEKDEAEDEFERLVLGDEAGFKAELGRNAGADNDEDDSQDEGQDGSADAEELGLEGVDDADLFFLDDGPSDSNALVQIPGSEDDSDGDAPAWEDSDDDQLAISLAGNSRLRKLRVNESEDVVSGREYARRLRRQFERLNPVPEWASNASARPAKRQRRSSAGSESSVSSNDMDVDESDLSTLPLARLLQDAGSLTRAPSSKKLKLRAEVIDIQRTKDIPLTQPSAITSLTFHPEHPVLLSAGPASTLYLHHIAPAAHPTPHPLLTSVHIKQTPINTAAFLLPKGDKIFFSGRRRYFHTWDLPSGSIQKVSRVTGQQDEQRSMERFKLSPCGRYMGLVGSSKKGGGIINILDAKTTQWIASARIEGRNGVADFAWWRNGEGMTIVGKGGEVGEWSIESRSFIAHWNDDGSVGATVLSLGGSKGPKELGGDRWVVIGSQSGVINIYDRRHFVSAETVAIPKRPEPTRRLMQLTTPTSNVAFSPDGQLLVVSSRWKKDALRLVHLPSCSVFKNWPTATTPLGRITAVAFSSGSDMLAVANEAGKIRLWEIRA